MKKIKTLILILLNSILTLTSIHAFEAEDIKTFTLENGLKIHVLEDTSSAVIRMEISIEAGYRFQDEKNAGFFSLYANLLGLEISGDRVRTQKTLSPLEFEKSVSDFSKYLRGLNVSDSKLKSAYSEAKKNMAETSSSAAGFINSAVETKMYPQHPWKNENSINPKQFSSKSLSELRTTLGEIGDNFYTAARTSIFISGNISPNSALAIVKKYFDDFPARQKLQPQSYAEKKLTSLLQEGKLGKEKKFVLYDKSFSDEMTQIVVEYKDFSTEESDILAAVWNENESPFKALLLKQRNLKILGADYIDAASSPERNAPRVIIQSLLGTVKVSPAVQAELFLEMSRDKENLSDDQIAFAQKKNEALFNKIKENSAKLMEEFARFVTRNEGADAQIFFDHSSSQPLITAEDLNQKIESSSPYVFVLVNSAVYTKHAKDFKNSGYVPLTSKNGAWYTQKIYADLLKQKSETPASISKETKTDIAQSAARFVEKHRADFSYAALKNGIPVCIKQDVFSNEALISLSIAGGDLLFAKETPGLTAVLTDSIAVNVQRQMDLFAANGTLSGYYDVSSQTFATHSVITISCAAKDIVYAIQSAYTALIFCDIAPAIADGVTYDERTQWRLKTGTGDFQLLCEAVRILYKDTDLPLLYQDTKDKPDDMTFTKILEGYPYLLDSSRFSIVVTGGIQSKESLTELLENTFGNFSSQTTTQTFSLAIAQPKFRKLAKRVAIRHLFLTDISKDKAGPMPAKLIPTTKFLDPILYCIPSPDLASTDAALFNALLIELSGRIEAKAKEKNPQSAVKLALSEPALPFARLTVTNVEHTADIDRIYKECVQSIKNDLRQLISSKIDGVIDAEKPALLAQLESGWILKVLSESGTPQGTARLIENGLILKNAELYLDQYSAVDNAQAEDYFLIAESLLETKPPLILYSKDSK